MKDWKLTFWPFNLHLNKFHDQINIYIGTNIQDYNKIKFTYTNIFAYTRDMWKITQTVAEFVRDLSWGYGYGMKDKSVVY